MILVHGDTTTTFVAEVGSILSSNSGRTCRSWTFEARRNTAFPEELNRVMVSNIAD
ncbi:hypothetical protein ACVXZZ_07250 [Staphylococcus aureus]